MTQPAAAPTIVVGVDGSKTCQRALEWGAGEAVRRGAPLRIVHAFPTQQQVFLGRHPDARAAAQQLLDDALERARPLVGDQVQIHTALAEGSPAEALIEESRRAALLVLGSRGHGGFADLALGSTAAHIAAHAACPATFLPRNELASGRGTGSVVVGVDASSNSTPALDFAFQRAADRGAGVVAVHTWHLPTDYGAYPTAPLRVDSAEAERQARKQLSTTIVPWRDRNPDVSMEERTVQGHTVGALADAAESGEVVVVGSHGRGFVAGRLLGSVSQGLLRHARRPVVIAR